jgi:hypothetical protein
VTKNSTTPTSVVCTLQTAPQSIVVASVGNAPIATSLSDATDPDIPDGSASNATIALAPGATGFITLRGQMTPDQMADVVRSLSPVVTAHGANTDGVTPDFALLLFIPTTNGGVLPAAVVGTPYSTTLTAVGGKGALTWTLASGALPSGLSLSSGGTISGTPTGSGTFAFTVRVMDSSSPTPQSATQSFTLSVSARETATSVSFGASPIVVGQMTSVSATVSDTQAGGTSAFPSGMVTLSGDPGLSAGSCALAPSASPGVSTCSVTITPASPGPRTITASYPGSAAHEPSAGSNTLTVQAAGTATALVSSLNPSVFGQAVTFTATLSVTAPGAGAPSGTVTFFDGATPLGSAAVASSSAAFTTPSLSPGVHPITAAYSGDSNFNASVSPVLMQTVNLPVQFTFAGFGSPLATAGTATAPSFSGNQNLGSAVPIKWQLFDSSGNNVTDLASTTSLQAVLNTTCSGAATGPATLLYSPTVGATGGSTFRSSSSGFIFNWDTSVVVPTGPACYTLVLQLSDGSAPRATTVQLR